MGRVKQDGPLLLGQAHQEKGGNTSFQAPAMGRGRAAAAAAAAAGSGREEDEGGAPSSALFLLGSSVWWVLDGVDDGDREPSSRLHRGRLIQWNHTLTVSPPRGI